MEIVDTVLQCTVFFQTKPDTWFENCLMSTLRTEVLFFLLTCLGFYSVSSSFYTVLDILVQNEIKLGDNEPVCFQQIL